VAHGRGWPEVPTAGGTSREKDDDMGGWGPAREKAGGWWSGAEKDAGAGERRRHGRLEERRVASNRRRPQVEKNAIPNFRNPVPPLVQGRIGDRPLLATVV
jgi:hypothetical protein